MPSRHELTNVNGTPPSLSPLSLQAPGYAVVHFANEMLRDRNDALSGKRVLILGSGKVARSVASKLLEYGAIPLTFSDASGHVYEPDGIGPAKLNVIDKIKNERGALLGRFIISSTTARFNDPSTVTDIPCDLCIPCGAMHDLDAEAVNALADNGCQGVIEGGHSTVTAEARKVLKKRGLLYGPDKLTLTGASISNALGKGTADEALAAEISRVYKDVCLSVCRSGLVSLSP